ncbi:cytochrome P450, partial [Dichotomocladium elegans]
LTSILAIAFGNMCSFSFGDPRLQEVFSLTERSAALLGPSEQLREFFPILRFILPSTKQKFIDVRNKGQAFYGDLLKEFKERQQQKQQQGGGDESNDECCFVKEILANGDLSDRQIVDFMVLLIGAGSDTTASTVEWMVALLANHPDIQEKVYDEIKE